MRLHSPIKPCIKTKFRSRADAEFYMQKLQRKSTRQKIPKRAYLCKCQSWHLTSKPKSQLAVKYEQLRHQNELLNAHITDLKKKMEHTQATSANKIAQLTQSLQQLKQDGNRQVMVDKVVQQYQKNDVEKNKLISKLRADNKMLIAKLQGKNNGKV